MAPLESLIRTMITRDGPITVEQFMDLALAHPEQRDSLNHRDRASSFSPSSAAVSHSL